MHTIQIGYTVSFIDKHNPKLPHQTGRVVGTDPTPPEKFKRKGPCYVIHPHNGEEWLYRNEDEILEVQEVV